jgi:hypothetical protein
MPSFFKKFKSFFLKKDSNKNLNKSFDHESSSISLKNFSLLAGSKLDVLKNIKIDETNTNNHYIALYDYKKQATDDCELVKNDLLILIHTSYPNVCLIKNLRTKSIGFVPNNFIISINNFDDKE